MKFTPKQIIIIAGGALLVIVVFFLIYVGMRPASETQKFTLTVWGTDPKSVFDDLGAAYKASVPGATINYTQIDPANYQNQLLQAFAAGTGPDLFEVTNRQVAKWQLLAAPLPAAYASSFNETTLEDNFPTVVAQDFLSGGQIYGLPLDLDTLAMYYNKDLFDSAGIVYPPTTWDEFESDVSKLRTLNAQGQITQSAAALGGSETSIADAPDLVFLLMLQNGTQMVTPDGTAANFNAGGQNGSNPGLSAFNFYLQFANSASPYYTWNDAMGDATQNFIAGETAIIFDYDSAAAAIKQKAPFLNFGVAAMPQPTGATIDVNYPKYEGLMVSRQGQVSAAWSFVLFATANATGQAVYTKDTGEPPASRAAIAANLNDPNLGVFASQALTARSWPEADDAQIDSIMNTAIQNVLNGSMDSTQALGVAQDSVSSLMQNP